MDFEFPYINPVWVILLVTIGLLIAAARRGWGWVPLWFVLGTVAVMLFVGVLTGLAIVPDGVDIFTFLIASLINLVAGIYMVFIRKHGPQAAPTK